MTMFLLRQKIKRCLPPLPTFFSSFQRNKKDDNPDSFERKCDDVEKLIQEGKYEEALERTDTIAREHPGSGKACTYLRTGIIGGQRRRQQPKESTSEKSNQSSPHPYSR